MTPFQRKSMIKRLEEYEESARVHVTQADYFLRMSHSIRQFLKPQKKDKK